MWYVEIQQLGLIEKMSEFKIFVTLWNSMNPNSSDQVAVLSMEMLENAMSRQSIWRALTALEKYRFIRRPKGVKSWGVVYVNPLVVRPFHLKGDRLARATDAFMMEQTKEDGDV